MSPSDRIDYTHVDIRAHGGAVVSGLIDALDLDRPLVVGSRASSRARRIEATLPDARLELIDAAHMPWFEHQELTADTLRAFAHQHAEEAP